MSEFKYFRFLIAVALSLALAYHGKSKKSLNMSGAVAAVIVGFCSFAASYRFGILLILFYYSSSKLTKLKEDIKAKLEADYAIGGQRNWIQVFANSIIATAICVVFYAIVGEDIHVNFQDTRFASDLWILYIAHYSCATADTWASEVGILSSSQPRLVTSLFMTAVPPGTNGGMSVLGTAASLLGGAFIGFVFWILGYICVASPAMASQWPAVWVGAVAGVVGSLLDSLMGATLQATYYSTERRCIVKEPPLSGRGSDVIKICGINILTNEQVNFWSIALTCGIMYYVGPFIYCVCDSNHC